MYSNAILGLMAQTSIHAGASSNEGAVDLPIQREAHTDWPVIYGSGVKGAFRAHFEHYMHDSNCVTELFGPDTASASEHAGAMMVSDARLLLLPVRSMTSHTKWVTCPALLSRFMRDKKRMGLSQNLTTYSVPDDGEQAYALTTGSEDRLYLEEYAYTVIKKDMKDLISELCTLTLEDLESEFNQNLVIVSDHQFRYLARSAVPVNAHIAIDSASKIVKPGALWYQESLPPETLFYCALGFSAGRSSRSRQSADELKGEAKSVLVSNPYLQVGANLTTGMGWFETNWLETSK